MPSWVRYSVAVYVGLLLAGALVTPWVAGGRIQPATQQSPRRPEAMPKGDINGSATKATRTIRRAAEKNEE